MRLITFARLGREKGIDYCRDHLRRLCDAGKFPRPIPISGRRIGWEESEIDDWIAKRAAQRDAKILG
jgi:prophage regulatory protein